MQYAALSLLAVAGISLTSCSDDESYDVYGNNQNFIYINPSELRNGYNCEVVTTPAGVFGQVEATINAKLQYATKDTVKISAHVNASQELVDAYNAAHSTEYVLPSQDVLNSLQVLEASGIGANKTYSEKGIKVQLPADKVQGLKVDDAENAPTYIIPVSLKFDGAEGPGTDRPFAVSEDNGTSYIVVKTSKVDDFTSITSSKTVKCGISKNKYGIFGGISASFSFKNLIAVTGDMQGTLVADNSLVATYNSENSTNYSALPSSVLSQLVITPATVKEGETATETGITVTAPESATNSLEGTYVLPLRLKTSFANGATVDEDDVVYIVVEVVTSLIKEISSPSDIVGTLLTDYTGWTAKYDSGTEINASELFDGNLENGAQLRKDGANGKTKVVIVDMGASKNVSGFRFSRYYKSYYGGWWAEEYYFSSVKIETSTDGTTWEDCGTVTESDMPKQSGYQHCSFYGGVPARYLRLSIESGASSVSSLGELGVYVSE